MSIEAMKQQKLENIISGYWISNDDADWLRAALSQQPVIAWGEPVGYMSYSQIAQLRERQVSHAYVYPTKDLSTVHPVYTQPAPSVPADVVRDAERGRFLLEWLERYGLLQAEFGQMGVGEKPEDWWLLHAPGSIDKTRPFFGHGKTPEQAIDAAMLAAKEGGA